MCCIVFEHDFNWVKRFYFCCNAVDAFLECMFVLRMPS